MSVSRNFHRFWFTIIAVAIAAEGWAIARHGAGYTMSEWVWSKIREWPLRSLVAAFLAWVLYHFVWRGPRGFSKIDLAAVFAGAAFGIVAYKWGWH